MRTDNALPWQQEIAGATNAVIRWHVNVFIIITGYFGIKSRWGIIKIVTISLFYTWVLYVLECLFCEERFSFTTIAKSFFFVSHSRYWFVQSYILLMLIAPFINELIGKKSLPMLFGSFLFIDCWCGYIHNDTISNGFGILHFATMYLIGEGIRLYYSNIRNLFLLIMFVITCGLLLLQFFYFKNLTSGNGYNNPLLVMNAIIVFLAFKKMSITSNIINKVAVSSFSVYLIHDSGFGHYWMKKGMIILNQHANQPLMYLFALILISILIYLLCTIIDKISARLYMPITHGMTNILKTHIIKR